MSDKELNRILAELKRQGFTVTLTRKNHLIIKKAGMTVAAFASTASDYRSLRNSLADCKRAGFIWPPSTN